MRQAAIQMAMQAIKEDAEQGRAERAALAQTILVDHGSCKAQSADY